MDWKTNIFLIDRYKCANIPSLNLTKHLDQIKKRYYIIFIKIKNSKVDPANIIKKWINKIKNKENKNKLLKNLKEYY